MTSALCWLAALVAFVGSPAFLAGCQTFSTALTPSVVIAAVLFVLSLIARKSGRMQLAVLPLLFLALSPTRPADEPLVAALTAVSVALVLGYWLRRQRLVALAILVTTVVSAALAWRNCELSSALAEQGWGSITSPMPESEAEQAREDARRLAGLKANNRAVELQEKGDDAAAFAGDCQVLDEIDSENLSAMFNLLSMAEAGYAPAKAREEELRKRLKKLTVEEYRKVRLPALVNFHGKVRVAWMITAEQLLRHAIEQGEREGAAALAEAILERAEDHPLANYIIGSVKLEKGDAAAAEKHFEKALKAKPDFAFALNDLAEAEKRLGKFEAAEAHARAAVAAAPELKTAHETLAEILQERERKAKGAKK